MRSAIIRRAAVAVVLLAAAAVLWMYLQKRRAPAETAPEYVFTYAENQSADYPTAQGAQYFADLVFERTGGRIKINVYTDSQLGDEPSVLEQLQYGGIDFARVSVMSMADQIPMLNILQLPYLYNDSDHMWRVLDGAIGDDFLAALEGHSVVGLSWYDAGARHFYNRVRPISCLEDLSGLRIRVAESGLMFDMVAALGATPVTVTYDEVYSAMETGQIDGAENNWPSYESKKHWESASYITLDAHSRIPELQLCAQSTWEKLSEADQELLCQCAQESALYERQLWAQTEAEVRKQLEGVCTVTTLSAEELERFREAVQPIYEKYGEGYQNLIRRIRRIGEV